MKYIGETILMSPNGERTTILCGEVQGEGSTFITP